MLVSCQSASPAALSFTHSLPHVVQVMAEVRALTKLSITVVATVHSPTPYCFTLFDRLMIILSGRIVYCGNRGDGHPHMAHGLATTVLFVPTGGVVQSSTSLRC